MNAFACRCTNSGGDFVTCQACARLDGHSSLFIVAEYTVKSAGDGNGDRIAAMRIAVASLLMTLLVAMTSWASACDLSCSLERSHSVCRLDGAATASTGQVAPRALAGRAQQEMAMDPTMVMSDEISATQGDTGAPHLHSNSCAHSPCNETSISAISKSATQQPAQTLPFIAFVQAIASSSLMHVSSIAAKQDPPDLPPFDPLSISLRI
jgi:hypothetical protein